MAHLLGGFTLPLLGASVFIAVLTYLSYRMLSDYLHKWFEMKPIPGMEGTYPLIGNALQFKPNAGGEGDEEDLQPHLTRLERRLHVKQCVSNSFSSFCRFF